MCVLLGIYGGFFFLFLFSEIYVSNILVKSVNVRGNPSSDLGKTVVHS